MSNYFLDIMALGMFFVYQLEIFKYTKKILIGAKQSALQMYIFALVNCLLLLGSVGLSIQHEFFYGLVTIVLAIEFKLFSKASWLQVFCGSSIFAMNIAAFTIPTVAIIGRIAGIAPVDVLHSPQYRGIAVFASCFVLSVIVLPVVKICFSTNSIQHVTNAGKYSLLLLVSVLGTVLYESVLVATIFNDLQYNAQLLLTIFTSVFVITSFYYLFGYSCTLLDAAHYQKQSDALTNEKIYLESTKTVLSEKMERDALTGVYNRRYMISFLEDVIAEQTVGFTVLFVDINALKMTNDQYGHASGDRLICRVAKVLSNVVRERDAVSRVGGDEFVVVLTSEHRETAKKIMERIEVCLTQEELEEEFSVSASIGALYVDRELQLKGVDYILSKADEEMRINKKSFYA